MADYDAVVIGAGPGGSSAAYFLARAGARVAVLERKHFPRSKTCGDGLTPRSIKVLEEMGLHPAIDGYQRVRGLRVIGAGTTMELDFPALSGFQRWGYVRPRRQIDAEAAEAARLEGAEFFFGYEASEPLRSNGLVEGVRWVRKEPAPSGGVTKVDEGAIRAHFTVVADGASSPFGRALGLSRRSDYPLGLAIRTYYRSDRSDDDFFESWLELRKDGELLPGYGWVFPVGDGTVNVGVGLLTTFGQWRSVNLGHLQRAFVDMLPASYGITHEGQTEKYQSGRLPMGGSLTRPHGPGYIVIGDAAGMVNPFNGEGIAYALETGQLAASVVAEALSSGGERDPVRYREALHDIYGAYYRMGRKFVRIIGRPRAFKALCQVGMRSRRIMDFVLRVLANLEEESGGKVPDRAFRALRRLADFELPKLSEPEIPAPPVRGKQRVTSP